MATSTLDSTSQSSVRTDRNHHAEGKAGQVNVGDLLRLALPLDTTLQGAGADPRRDCYAIAY